MFMKHFCFSFFLLMVLSGCSDGKKSGGFTGSTPPFTGQSRTPEIDRAYIDQCVAINSGKEVRVQRDLYTKCTVENGTPYYRKLDQNHILSISEDGLVELNFGKLYFVPADAITYDANGTKFETDIADFEKSKSIILENNSCVKDFYARHGIKLTYDLVFSEDKEEFQDKQVIELVYADGRSHSGKFFLRDERSLCGLLVHEYGHWLGLHDRYFEEGRCEQSEIRYNNLNIMNTIDGASLDKINFLPQDVRLMLDPLCGEVLDDVDFSEDYDDIVFGRRGILPIDSLIGTSNDTVRNSWQGTFYRKYDVNAFINIYGDEADMYGMKDSLDLVGKLIDGNYFRGRGMGGIIFNDDDSYQGLAAVSVEDDYQNSWTVDEAYLCASVFNAEMLAGKECLPFLKINIHDNEFQILDKLDLLESEAENFKVQVLSSMETFDEVKTKLESLTSQMGKKVLCEDFAPVCLDKIDKLASSILVAETVEDSIYISINPAIEAQRHMLCYHNSSELFPWLMAYDEETFIDWNQSPGWTCITTKVY